MKCAYISGEITAKSRARKLTSDEKIKLRLYEMHLQEKRTDLVERKLLINYMIDHDLDAELIKYL